MHFKDLISFPKNIKLILQETFLKKKLLNNLKTYRFLSLNPKQNKNKNNQMKKRKFQKKYMKKKKKNIKKWKKNIELKK